MKERLLHILDGTACLTRRQMKDYLAGTMLPEEIHAAEAHIASCPLCNMALEGFEANSEEALAAIGSLNSGFLKEHFDAITPQIHLNSLSPATVVNHHKKKKTKTISLLRLMSVAALALLAVGVFWYLKYGQDTKDARVIAMRDEAEMPAPTAATQTPATVRIADSIMAQPTTSSRSNTAALDEPAPIIKEAKKPAPVQAAEDIVAQNKVADNATADYEKDASPSMAATPTAAPGMGSRQVMGKMNVDQQKPSLAKSSEDKAKKERADSEQMRDEVAFTSNAKVESVVVSRSANTADRNTDHLQKGDEYFGAGKYGAALKSYRAAMSNGDRSRSAQASVMAARCYINLGQKAKGIELLQRVVNEASGSQRRQAKRLLRELERNN